MRIESGSVEQGDGVEFRGSLGESTGSVVTYVKDIGGSHYLLGDFDRRINIGDSAYKVTDKQLTERALSRPEKKLPVTMSLTARTGQYMSLVMTDVRSGFSTEVIADHVVEKAVKSATAEDRIVENLCRLGDTPFTANQWDCDVQSDDDAMVPLSLINRMRREAADRLYDERTGAIRRERNPLTRAQLDVIEANEMLGADSLDTSKYEKAFSAGRIKPVPIENFMKGHSGEEVPYILNISKGNLDKYIEENFNNIVNEVSDTGILIGNLGWIKQFLDAGVKVYGDYGLNVYNRQAEKLFEDIGIEVYAPSHETGIADLRGIPLMITEHPVRSGTLTDRKGAVHRVVRAPSGDKTLII